MSASLVESFRHRVLAVERVTTRAALIASVGMLALAATAAFYQVITRFVFNDPSHFSEVASRSLIIWSVFLGAANVFRRNEMMRVEVIFSVVPRRVHVALEYFITLLCLLFFLLLAYYSYRIGVRVQPQRMAGMDVSMAWAYSALPVGSVFAVIALIGRLLDPAMRELPPETTLEGVSVEAAIKSNEVAAGRGRGATATPSSPQSSTGGSAR